MNEKSINMNIFDFIYGFYIFNNLFIVNVSDSFSKIINIILLCLLFVKYLVQKHSKKELFISLSLLIITILSFFYTGKYYFLIFILFFITSSFVNDRNTVKLIFKIMIISVIMTFISYILGLSKDFIMYRYDSNFNILGIRHSYGFDHPNTLSYAILTIIIMYIYIYTDKIDIFKSAIIMTIELIFYNITGNRSAVIISFIAIILNYGYKNSNRIYINLIKNSRFLPIILAMISIISVVCYSKFNNNLINEINMLMSGRIKSASYFLFNYPIKLFGNNFELTGTVESSATGKQEIILDNFYISLLSQYGAIFFCGTIYLYYKALKSLTIKKRYLVINTIILILIIGISEQIAIFPKFNFTFIFLSRIIFWGKKVEKK